MVFEKLKKIITEVKFDVAPDEIRMESTFMHDLGADSLDVYQIIENIQDEFDIEISPEDAEKITTVGDAVKMIEDAIK